MKKRFIFLLTFLWAASAMAQNGRQVAGLQVGTFGRDDDLPGFSGNAGGFYDYQFSRRFGMGAALFYRFENSESSCMICPGTEFMDGYFPAKNRFHFLELPLNLSVNLNKRENANWKTDILLGYTYSRILGYKQRATYNGEELEGQPQYYSSWNNHYANLGLEVKHEIGEKYQLAINPGLRVMIAKQYPDNYFYFQMKFGRIL